MMNKSMILGVVALFALPAAGLAQTVTLLNENFDELTPQLAATQVGAFHTIAGTNVDIFGPGFPMAAPDLCRNRQGQPSGHCVDMNGTANSGPNGNPQGILVSNQTFTLEPGNSYHLTFDLSGSGRNANGMQDLGFCPTCVETSLTASFGNDSISLFRLASLASGLTHFLDPTVNVPTPASIVFRSDTPGDVGMLLDNIRLTCTGPTCTRVGETVPEPATVGLMVLGLLGAGFAGRRRRN